MRAYKLKVAAGASVDVAAVGDYVRLKSAAIGLGVTVVAPDSGEEAILEAGDSLHLSGFARLRVFHDSAVEQVLTLYVGKGTRLDSSRVAGVVSVISGERERVLAGAAFMGVAFQSSVAAEYPHVQIYNTSASGKLVLINRVTVSASVANAPLRLAQYATPLAAFDSFGASKLIGAPASATQMRAQSSTVVMGDRLSVVYLGGAYESKEVFFSEPIILRPGYGFSVVPPLTVNCELWASFQWSEEAL